MLSQVLITLLVAAAGGFVGIKLIKIPGGGIVVPMLFVAVFNVTTGQAAFPFHARVVAQSIMAAFLVAPITLAQIKSMRRVLGPALFVSSGLLVAVILIGFLSAHMSDMSLLTALFAAAPGGMADLVLISIEFGADPMQVSLIQSLRIFFIMMLCPLGNRFLIEWLERKNPDYYLRAKQGKVDVPPRAPPPGNQQVNTALTLVVALGFGTLGFLTGIPAGALIFALMGACVFNICTNRLVMPSLIRRVAQVLAGAIIGSNIGGEDLFRLQTLLLPVVLVIGGLIAMNLILGLSLFRFSSLDLRTCMFATTPAGVIDMALIAAEMDGDGPSVALLQILRYVTTIVLFPQIFLLIVFFFP